MTLYIFLIDENSNQFNHYMMSYIKYDLSMLLLINIQLKRIQIAINVIQREMDSTIFYKILN